VYEMYDISVSDICIKNIVSVCHDIRMHDWTHVNSKEKNIHTIDMVLKGSYSLECHDKTFIARENDFLYVPPNTTLKTRSITLPTDIIMVYFTAETENDSDANIFNNEFILSNCNDSIKNSFKNIKHSFLLKQPGYPLDIKKDIYKILSEVVSKTYTNNLGNYNYYIIKNADKYIKENYLKEVISIEHLANLCNITPSYFTRIFKSVFGMSPKKYISDLKMQAACEYLTYTSTSVMDISKTLGYEDLTYFSSSFKKHFGVTPVEYRRKHTILIK